MDHGYIFIKKHQNIETFDVKYSKAQITRKFNEGSCEINIYTIPKGKLFFIDPAERENAVKTYYIISGNCKNTETNEQLGQGDMIVVKKMGSKLNFEMLDETKFLVHANNNEAFKAFTDISLKISKLLDEIQAKDHYTKEHCDRVFGLAQKMALLLGYKSDKLYDLSMAARYHDVGKIYIDDIILNKPGKLDDTEYLTMQQHVLHGEEMISKAFGQRIFEIISQHHERIDGTGYPTKLKGSEIMQEARILAICDSYDAMVTDRIYKMGKTTDEALAELIALAGIKYDAELVTLFVKMLREL